MVQSIVIWSHLQGILHALHGDTISKECLIIHAVLFDSKDERDPFKVIELKWKCVLDYGAYTSHI